MDEKELILLFEWRDETAIEKAEAMYGRLCKRIAFNILQSESDAEECVNDAFLALWNSVPPACPKSFKAYIAKITRNLALNRLEYNNAEKRNSAATVSLSELEEVVADCPEERDEDISELINIFLKMLKREARVIFVKRYWFFESVTEIANELGISPSKVSTVLFRTKSKLKDYLNKEGINL